MKKLFPLLLLCLGLLASCGEDPKTPEELALEKISGAQGFTYTLGSTGYVKRNQVDESKFYTGLSLRLQGTTKSYTSSGASDLFDASGNWEFVGTNFDKIRLTGSKPASQVDISYTKNGQELVLVFSVPTPPGGRVASLTGNYEIKLTGN
ncbi:MAG: hypothetical protein NBV61_05835 [Algoriphagus sp.]|jgi:hypothetical protein|nr:hypothetical protein [Algoriphagus sp.]